jgi:hypothetical protein
VRYRAGRQVEYAVRVRLVACLGLIALAACGSEESVARSDHAIEGTVVDEFTKQGLGGATVRFVSDTLDQAETVSEPDGRFTLDVLVVEGVRFGTLEASRDGYNDSKRISVYFDGSALRTELPLRPKN